MKRVLPLLFVCAIAGDAAAEAVKTEEPAPLRIAPSYDGHVGAWL